MRVEHLSEVFSEKTQQGRKQRCAGEVTKPRGSQEKSIRLDSPTQTCSIREWLAQGVFRNRKLTEGVQNYAGNKKTNLPETLWAQLPRSFHTHSPDLSPAETLFSPDRRVMPTQAARALAHVRNLTETPREAWLRVIQPPRLLWHLQVGEHIRST